MTQIFAAEHNFTGCLPPYTDQYFNKFSLPVSVNPGKTQNLAAMYAEIDVLKQWLLFAML